MREYIVLCYSKNSLVFDYRILKDDEKDVVNSNIFYEDSLFYTLKYFKKHLNEIIIKIKGRNKEIDWFIVMRIITFDFAVQIMEGLSLTKLRLLFNSTLSVNDYETILDINKLEKVDCYYMPSFMVTKFKKEGIEVKNNNKYVISSEFMIDQDAIDLDSLYYKDNIDIRRDYKGLLDDVQEFLRINYNLSVIDIFVYSKEIISKVVDLVKNDESKNVVVVLHQQYDKGNFIKENFAWLKRINQDCKQELTCEFRILYSKDFVKNNLFKQLTFNNLKLMFILSIYLCVSGLLLYKSYSYVEKLNTDKLKASLINDSANTTIEITETLNGIDVGLEEGEEIPKEVIKSKYEIDNVMSSLLSTNSDTVGYLVVKDTNIAYPVTHTSDNNYYLKHDFYKNYTSMGWIFLDYRNSKDKLDINNIIYGHSMKNGTMFGTLKKVLSSSWRNNSDNMTINYDTGYGSYKFKIFSTYKVDYTTDYLKVDFNGEEDFNNFVKLITDRSVFKSREKVEYGDIILTLSTCSGSSNQRLVVHAVLIQ